MGYVDLQGKISVAVFFVGLTNESACNIFHAYITFADVARRSVFAAEINALYTGDRDISNSIPASPGFIELDRRVT